MLITSLQNPRVKAAVQLRTGRQRRKQGRLLIDGARESLRALQAGLTLHEVWVCDELCQSVESHELLARIAREYLPIEVLHVTRSVFEKLAFGDRADGILAVATPTERTLEQLQLDQQPLLGVLSNVEKPGNIGAIMRSADGAGLTGLIIADSDTDLYNPQTIRSSLGTIFGLNCATGSNRETLDWLRAQRLQIFAAALSHHSISYTQVDFRQPCAIVLGSEDQGLDPSWLKPSEQLTLISLPMRGSADSLNVSATAAVLFYEAQRQRGVASKG